jgi:hypothetical protein
LKADVSAISSTLPQRGQFGRPRALVGNPVSHAAGLSIIAEFSSTFRLPYP